MKRELIVQVMADTKTPPKTKTEVAKRAGVCRETVSKLSQNATLISEVARRKLGQMDCARALIEGNQARLLQLVDECFADPDLSPSQKLAVLGSSMKLGLDIRDRMPNEAAQTGPDKRDRYQAARNRLRCFQAGLVRGSNGSNGLLEAVHNKLEYLNSVLTPHQGRI